MSCVFDYGQMVLRRNLQDGVTIARVTIQMYRHDRSYSQSKVVFGSLDLPANAVWIEVQSVRLNIGKDGRGTDMLDHVHCGAECERRSNDRVSGADSESQE